MSLGSVPSLYETFDLSKGRKVLLYVNITAYQYQATNVDDIRGT